MHAEDRLTAVLGVDDLVVVTTPDAVLVLPRERAEDVKELVAALKAGRGAARRPTIAACYRPWGHYESIDRGERFQVKRIVVTPGGTAVAAEALSTAPSTGWWCAAPPR